MVKIVDLYFRLTIFAVSLQPKLDTRVAKLVDALVSGSSGVTTLSVRVRSRVLDMPVMYRRLFYVLS